jgi:hypothetical protein
MGRQMHFKKKLLKQDIGWLSDFPCINFVKLILGVTNSFQIIRLRAQGD